MTGTACCVPGCHSNTKYTRRVSWHKFPAGSNKLQRQWIGQVRRATKKENWIPRSHHTKICGRHFNTTGYKLHTDLIPLYFPKRVKQHVVTDWSGEQVLEEHNYVLRKEIVLRMHNTIEDMVEKIHTLEAKAAKTDKYQKEQERTVKKALKAVHLIKTKRFNELRVKSFIFDRILQNPEALKFYTGFENSTCFYKLASFLKVPYKKRTVRGKFSSMSMEEELFLIITRLKLGFIQQKLAQQLDVTPVTLGKLWRFWIAFLDDQFRTVNIQMNKKKDIIVDCLRIGSRNVNEFVVYKGLIGISPYGLLCYVSDLYPHSTSDQHILEVSGILKRVSSRDAFFSDTGFFLPNKRLMLLNRTNMFNGKTKPHSSRLRVERFTRCIRSYKILETEIVGDSMNKVWKICCFLTNCTQDIVI